MTTAEPATEPHAPANYVAILAQVNAWPEAFRLALMRDLLQALTATGTPPAPRRRKHGLEHAIGLLATDRPAPTDEEVEQWIDELRREKYGPW